MKKILIFNKILNIYIYIYTGFLRAFPESNCTPMLMISIFEFWHTLENQTTFLFYLFIYLFFIFFKGEGVSPYGDRDLM